MSTPEHRFAYWRANVVIVASLLAVWFVVSFLCGIVFVDELDQIRLGGFKLGFWISQQGSLFVYILLIFLYVWRMNYLDRKHDVHED